jgi:hypothetical protein
VHPSPAAVGAGPQQGLDRLSGGSAPQVVDHQVHVAGRLGQGRGGGGGIVGERDGRVRADLGQGGQAGQVAAGPDHPPGAQTPGDQDLGLVDALAQLSFQVHNCLAEIAADHDLSIVQTRLLGVLRDREPTTNELGRHLGLDKSSISSLVDRAQRRGPETCAPTPGQPGTPTTGVWPT